MAQAAVGMVSGTCAVTANVVKEVYELSLFQANLTNFCYYIMYVPGNFMSIAILNRYGMKVTIACGTLFILIGAWIRCFIIFTNFMPFYVGSFIAALGQPFLMNLPSKVASNWFGDKERATASSLGALSVFIGAMLSFTLPQLIFANDYSQNFEQGRRDFCMFLMIQTLLISVLTIPALSFVKEEPPSPPSIVANDTNNDMGLKEGLKELATNKNYILMFLIYLLIYGIHASMGAVYANLAATYDYNVA
jgi:MFS transporter, FLVCR family, MFS-domain-containing protein 7